MHPPRISASSGASPDISLADRGSPGRSIFRSRQWLSLARSLQLSDRELEIVQCLFDDRTELAMARQLDISTHTIHSHLERLYRKLGVTSRCGAVVRVVAEHFNRHPTKPDDRDRAHRPGRPHH